MVMTMTAPAAVEPVSVWPPSLVAQVMAWPREVKLPAGAPSVRVSGSPSPSLIERLPLDVAELATYRIGIRALASLPLPTEKRNEGQRDVAVTIQGIPVRPGDWIVADADGTLVLSQPPR